MPFLRNRIQWSNPMLRPLALLLTLASCPLFAVVAVSGGGVIYGGTDWWSDGSKNPASFGILDEDGDGKLSNNEMFKARQQLATALKETKSSLINAVDLDQSGKMSRYEGAEAMPRWVSLRERARELAVAMDDKNGDGKLSPDETGPIEQRIGNVFVKYGVARIDTNKDKNFSRAEVTAAIMAIKEGKGAMFTLCDISNDGQLSVREADMAFEILSAAAGL
jgi:Ca2+-binding EF-hand superfamily protein